MYILQSPPLCSNGVSGEAQAFHSKVEMLTIDQSLQRRSANYKPNIWKPNLLHSLNSEYSEEEYGERGAEKLIEEVREMFMEAKDQLAKLELVDSITKLGLANHFEKEIEEALSTIGSTKNNTYFIGNDLYATSLCFRLLRQYGYDVSQDMLSGFVGNKDNLRISTQLNVTALLELFEASNLGFENETTLTKAREFSTQSLRSFSADLNDRKIAKQLNHTLDLPLHWSVGWYNVRGHIQTNEEEDWTNTTLLKLAKLNFNIVQSEHQKNLKEIISRWWKNLGITEKLSFSRDRIVESFLFATGVASKPQHGNLRKWLTKVIQLILIIDDVYDIYGSLQELEVFTNAVERWNPKEVHQLPECMRSCFQILYDTTDEIALEIQKETSCDLVLIYLQKAWADFCKSLLLEAKWYNEGHTPSLQDYLSNGWISSSGPLISLHIIFSVSHETKEALHFLESSLEIVYYTSLIIRLTNDQQTSAAELERGDAASSILCYMREANVSEEVAREYIRNLIMDTWIKINNHFFKLSQVQQQFVKYIVNIGRVAHFIYQHGDGFGVQDREIKDQVITNLIEPIAIK